MRQRIHLFWEYFLVLLAAVLLCPLCCFAETFNLSYSLTEGGFSLGLDQATPYKGVKITVSSDAATQYEVIQRLTAPLVNRDNPSLVLRDNFVIRGLSGTNQYGSFRAPPSDSPVRSEEMLYVSDASGHADSFTVVYGAADIQDIAPGYYSGKIAFILNPINSTRPQVKQVLDVYVKVSPEQQARSTIEIATEGGSKYIVLDVRKEAKRNENVVVKINSKSKKVFSITQFLLAPLESEDGHRLEEGVVNFVVKEAKKGAAPNQPQSLSSRPQTVYTSSPNQEPDNYFVITYGLGDFTATKAGKYRSRIQYYLENEDKQAKIDTLDIEVDNDRVFDLDITPGDNRYGVEFRDVKPNEPPRKSEVEIAVASNLGKRYQVSQEVYSDLTNKDGNIIPAPYFTLRTLSSDTKGTLRFSSASEVKKGSSVLFVSDEQGSPDKFKVVYELKCPADLRAGDYSTRITYSLSEI